MDTFEESTHLLVKAILSLKTEEECRAFLEDLMTGKEIQDCSQRLFVAKLLREKHIYNDIVASTGASTATISRVNRCYTYGSGGYKLVLERISPASPAAADSAAKEP